MISGITRLDDEELARQIVDNWMDSPAHRENLLNDKFNYSGIGVCLHQGEIRATMLYAQVVAWTNDEVPFLNTPRSILDVRTQSVGPAKNMAQCFLWSIKEGRPMTEPASTQNLVLNSVPSGQYRLMFQAVLKSSGLTQYMNYPGPDIKVE